MSVLALGGATPESQAVNKNKIKLMVKRELLQRGYTIQRILPCRERRGRKYRCEWRVKGTYTNGPQFSCAGFATYRQGPSKKRGKRKPARRPRANRRLRVDPCLNDDLWDLLLEAGLHPTAILKPKVKRGVYRFEWRAEGVREGGVPYRCKDVARYVRKKRQWFLGDCATDIDPAEPLMDQPGPHPTFGFNDDWTNSGYLDQIARATAIGADTLRFNISWASIESSRDQYDWRGMDVVVDRITRAGVTPHFIVISAPCWAQENPRDCSLVGAPRASEVGEYVEFATLVAQRYPQAHAIEVWNEANWTPYYKPKPDPKLYSSMVSRTADAVHATGTGIPVITAGLAPLRNTTDGGDKMAAHEFLGEVFENGGIGSADAIGYHVYFGEVDDHDFNMRQQISRIRRTMRNYGAGNVPIWITEYGIESTGSYNQQDQADILTSLYNTMRKIENIPVVLVHRFFEAPNDLTKGTDTRGIIDLNGKEKLAYCALGRAVGTFPSKC